MSYIKNYLFKRTETRPTSTGYLNSNIEITCGQSKLKATLGSIGTLYNGDTVYGFSFVTGVISSIRQMYSNEFLTCGIASLTGSLLTIGDLQGSIFQFSSVIGVMDNVNGFIFTNENDSGNTNLSGNLTSTAPLVTEIFSTCGSTTSTGSIINSTVYNYELKAILINNPDTAGFEVSKVFYNTDQIGTYNMSPFLTELQEYQPSFFESKSLQSTDQDCPKVLGESVKIIAKIKSFSSVPYLNHQKKLGHKFWYLISPNNYEENDLTQVLDQAIETSAITVSDYVYTTFPWNTYTDGSTTYIYIIVDYRSNSYKLIGSSNSISNNVGLLTASGKLESTINTTTTIIESNLAANNIFFGNALASYNTLELLSKELDIITTIYNYSWYLENIKRFALERENGIWNVKNEVSIQITENIRLGYVRSFNKNELTYLIDIDGKVEYIGQGTFQNNQALEFIHLPGVIHLESPSGYKTLSNNQNLKGHIILPSLTGQTGNMNHIFNNAFKVTMVDMPSLISLTLQLSNRRNFANMTSLKRAYMPMLQNISGNEDTSCFYNVPSGTVMYINPILETSNGGNRDSAVVYWEDVQNAEIRYVVNFDIPNAVNNLSFGTITETSVQLNFTAPANNQNLIDYYEAWINDGKQLRHIFTSYQEIINSGDFIENLESGTDYEIKIKTADILLNRSVFSNSIFIRTSGIRSEINTESNIIGYLSGVSNISIKGLTNGVSTVNATTELNRNISGASFGVNNNIGSLNG